MGDRGYESPRDLVLPLSAGFEALQSLLDAVLDALVVAGFEMQAVKIAAGSPIASVQRLAADKENGHRDRFRADARDLQHHLRRDRARDALEEIQVQVRLMSVPVKGVGVEAINRFPQRRVHFPAVTGIELDARFGDAAPLTLGFLALLRGKAGKKGIKRFIVVIEPVELAIAAQDESGPIKFRGALLQRKEHMP